MPDKPKWISQSIKLDKHDGWNKYTVEFWVYEGADGFEIRIHGVDPNDIGNCVIVREK